jgi:hypothetical protein
MLRLKAAKRAILAAAIVLSAVACVVGQISDANAYACNNRHYVNSSGHVVHSPSCGNESDPPQHTATCRDGSSPSIPVFRFPGLPAHTGLK